LLVKFHDDNSEPVTIAQAWRMVTFIGNGTMNIVDWFKENSHGHVDMSQSLVFGWLTLAQNQSDYKGSGTKHARPPRSVPRLPRADFPRERTVEKPCPARLLAGSARPELGVIHSLFQK
jgi:hypothetical protein